MKQLYGITQATDDKNDEYIYTIGSDGYIPLVLLALYSSGYKHAVERYLSLYSHTEKAKELIKKLNTNNPRLEKEIKNIADIFDQKDRASQERMLKNLPETLEPFDFDKYSTQPKNISKYFQEYPRDSVLDFSIYTSQLAQYMAILTPNFDTGHEGVPQVPSISHIAFHQREEFVKSREANETAFKHIVSEIVRVMKLRNIEVNEETMLVTMPSYKAISFRMYMYPGF